MLESEFRGVDQLELVLHVAQLRLRRELRLLPRVKQTQERIHLQQNKSRVQGGTYIYKKLTEDRTRRLPDYFSAVEFLNSKQSLQNGFQTGTAPQKFWAHKLNLIKPKISLFRRLGQLFGRASKVSTKRLDPFNNILQNDFGHKISVEFVNGQNHLIFKY